MSEHSPEPWKHVADSYEVVDAEGDCVCGGKNHWDRAAPGTADGQRIVACVNACCGLNPERVPELVAVTQAIITCWLMSGDVPPDDMKKAKELLAKVRS
jgi:hypothetical protein